MFSGRVECSLAAELEEGIVTESWDDGRCCLRRPDTFLVWRPVLLFEFPLIEMVFGKRIQFVSMYAYVDEGDIEVGSLVLHVS